MVGHVFVAETAYDDDDERAVAAEMVVWHADNQSAADDSELRNKAEADIRGRQRILHQSRKFTASVRKDADEEKKTRTTVKGE